MLENKLVYRDPITVDGFFGRFVRQVSPKKLRLKINRMGSCLRKYFCFHGPGMIFRPWRPGLRQFKIFEPLVRQVSPKELCIKICWAYFCRSQEALDDKCPRQFLVQGENL